MTSILIYKMHEGVGGCEGPRAIYVADLPISRKLEMLLLGL